MARLLPMCSLFACVYVFVMCLTALNTLPASTFLASPAPGRREAIQGGVATIASMLGAQAALADAQGEPLTCLRNYGPPIIKLKDAVSKGDMKAVLSKENKFKLLNTYWRNSPKDFAIQTQISEDLLDAAADGKKDQVKTLYEKYMAKEELKIFANLPPAPTYHLTTRDASMATR